VSHQPDDLKSIDPNAPHAFVSKLNMPFAVPRAAGPMTAGPEFAFRRENAAGECAICGKGHSDRIHEAAEQAADSEQWPV
jgi:hypothetical protein